VNTTSKGVAGGESSGQAPAASMLNTPFATSLDPVTNVLYIADTRNSAIAEVTGIAHAATSGSSGVGPIEPVDQIAVTGSGKAAQECAPSITASITYDLGASDATDAGNPSTYTNKTPDFDLVNPTRPGYTFAGWTGTGITGANTDVTIAQWTTGDLAFTATWTRITSMVSFTLDGQGAAIAPQTIEYGSTATKPADPTAGGYTFDGWFADASLSTPFDFATPITADTTVYAKWSAVAAVCTYAADNATLTKDEAKLTSAQATLAHDKALLKKATTKSAKASAQKKVTAETKVVAADQKAVTAAKKVVTADKAIATCLPAVHEATLTAAEKKLTADKVTLAKDKKALTADKKVLTKDKAALKKAKTKAAKASEQKKVTAETKKISALTKTIATVTKTVTADTKAVTAAKKAVAADTH
jgi:uncharacterized repeat protein (TIGR02543 family)